MNVFKTITLAALCFFNTGILGQDQFFSKLQQFEHDIMLSKAQANAVNNASNWAFKMLILCGSVGLGSFIGVIVQGPKTEIGFLLGGVCELSWKGVQTFGTALVLTGVASEYTDGVVRELEKNKSQFVTESKKMYRDVACTS